MVICTFGQTIVMLHVIVMRLREQMNTFVINFSGSLTLGFMTGDVVPKFDDGLEKRAGCSQPQIAARQKHVLVEGIVTGQPSPVIMVTLLLLIKT